MEFIIASFFLPSAACTLIYERIRFYMDAARFGFTEGLLVIQMDAPRLMVKTFGRVIWDTNVIGVGDGNTVFRKSTFSHAEFILRGKHSGWKI